MPPVTRFGYSLPEQLIPKIKKMAERVTNDDEQDLYIPFEGEPGSGKTTYSIAIAYFLQELTGREFSAKNVYFDLGELIEDYKSTSRKIFIWDEPAGQSMKRDKNEQVANLERLIMMARKRGHILLVNIAYFYKFTRLVVASRSHGMFHTFEIYNKKYKKREHRAIYIPKKNVKKLYDDWEFRHKLHYKKHASRRVKIHPFPPILKASYKHNVLSEFDIEYYNARKDEAIDSIGKKKVSKEKLEVLALKKAISGVVFPVLSGRALASQLGLTPQTYNSWRQEYHPELCGTGILNPGKKRISSKKLPESVKNDEENDTNG